MVVGEYKQPPAVGFDAQFKPRGFEQSVLETLQKANASLLADANNVSYDRRDAGAQMLSSTMHSTTTGSSVRHPPLPHRAVLADNKHEANPEPQLKEPDSEQKLVAPESRGDPFLVTSPLSSDDENQHARSSDDENQHARRVKSSAKVTRAAAQLGAELPTAQPPARTDISGKPSSPASSFGSGKASKTAAAANLHSPGSIIVGLKMVDYSLVRVQYFPAVVLRRRNLIFADYGAPGSPWRHSGRCGRLYYPRQLSCSSSWCWC
jgi:hypothetical protein